MKFLLGKKIGSSQVFDKDKVIPVTLIEAGPCYVTQIKTEDKYGYNAVQIGFLEAKKINKPKAGHLKKVGKNLKYLAEAEVKKPEEYKIGQEINVSVFEAGKKVDVSGVSKGRGFTGVIKRHGFHRGPMAHGSDHHREPGSIGSMFPQKVFKGKKLPGRYGAERVTVKNLEIIQVDPKNNLLAVKGAVPGARGGLVEVREVVSREQLAESKEQKANTNEVTKEQENQKTEESFFAKASEDKQEN